MKRFGSAVVVLAMCWTFVMASLGSSAQAGEFPVTEVKCGQIITKSIEVAKDIGPCENGLSVGADGIEIRFKGHALVGNGVGFAGVYNEGFDNVTIRQANIRDFDNGLFVKDAKNNRLINNNTQSNDVNGITIVQGSDHLLQGNISTENAFLGIVVGSTGTELTGNLANDNGHDGIRVAATTGGSIHNNKATGNSRHGVALSYTSDVHVFDNLMSSNDEDGLAIEGAGDHVIEDNKMAGNGGRGVSSENSDGNLFRANEIADNDSAGFFSQLGSGNVLKANKSELNAGHGISSLEADIKVKANRAKLNGFVNGADDDFGLGIKVPGSATGGDNIASGNDDPSQCAPLALCQ